MKSILKVAALFMCIAVVTNDVEGNGFLKKLGFQKHRDGRRGGLMGELAKIGCSGKPNQEARQNLRVTQPVQVGASAIDFGSLRDNLKNTKARCAAFLEDTKKCYGANSRLAGQKMELYRSCIRHLNVQKVMLTTIVNSVRAARQLEAGSDARHKL